MNLTDCIECREHRIDYYAELAQGHDPVVSRRAFKTKIALCDTNGDAQLAAYIVEQVARGFDDGGGA